MIQAMIMDGLDEKFREAVYKRYGLKKGAIKIALEEAIRLWLSTNRTSVQK
ncbi:MAG: hypothetical protein WB988_26750 [Candidatus Nitrosopolaris sp.]